MRSELLVLFVIVILVSNSGATYIATVVGTNTSSWYLYRQSQDIDFNYSSSVEGNISPVKFHGRSLIPYHSNYEEITDNDIRLRERTSALEGKFRSEDKMNLWSNADNDVNIYLTKPSGTNVFELTYFEEWPVSLRTSRSLEYSGKQINDRDFEGNNRDFVGSNLLYNPVLSEERRSVIWLERMNATVQATDDAILGAEFMPTKYLGYTISTQTTGIADLRYKQTSPQYEVKRRDYPAINEGEERYYGTYDLSRTIEMRSKFENNTATEENWLPCLIGDCTGVSFLTQYGKSGVTLFNCSCYPSDYSEYIG
ncbi:Uncharacterised protein [uncultured archaeon]|nr:Uncharacterised protein [uncultured archaeon]